MGLHRRLPRRRAGKSYLRLENSRSHFRHLPRTGRAAICANGIHAEGTFEQAGALPTSMASKGALRGDLHGLGVSAERLREVGRTGFSMGETRARALRSRGGGSMVLANLERSEHRLLARHS